MSGNTDLMPLTEWEAQMERLRVAIKNMNALNAHQVYAKWQRGE